MAKVLLVEPDKFLGQTYKQSLTSAGHDVVWQQTAASAIESLDTQLADVIILELQIAGHNGLEFLYELRSYQDWLAMPVIINSVLKPGVIAPMVLEQLGVNQHLYKTETTLAELAVAIDQELAKVKV